MFHKLYYLLFISTLFFASCEKDYEFQLQTPKRISVAKTFSIKVKEKNGQPIDKITYSFDGKELKSPDNVDLSKETLGKHMLSAVVFYGTKTKKLSNTIVLLAAKPPKLYGVKIVHTFPHDRGAYTQGLEYHKGFLYESTGRKGSSSLRKVALQTGKVLKKSDLDAAYFAEGMTLLHDKLYQLTWQSKKGFVYDTDFNLLKTFQYGQSLEGWGLCNDGQTLFKSDGTEKIWLLDTESLKETGHIEVYSNKQSVKNLNELEYVDGKIYANVWQKNIILIVHPQNGTIEGVIDCSNLVDAIKKTQSLEPNDDVLNGIAYDAEQKRLFVTGKHWGSLFEISLVEK